MIMKLNECTVKYSLIQRIAKYPLILLNTKRVFEHHNEIPLSAN